MMIVFLTLYITWVESGCIRYEECRIVTGSGDKSQLLSGGGLARGVHASLLWWSYVVRLRYFPPTLTPTAERWGVKSRSGRDVMQISCRIWDSHNHLAKVPFVSGESQSVEFYHSSKVAVSSAAQTHTIYAYFPDRQCYTCPGQLMRGVST